MKYIFIDLGAYNGDSIKYFMNLTNLPVAPEQFEIYAFEPNPIFYDDLINLPYNNIMMISPMAAWTEQGILEFAKDTTDTPMGSTVMKSKKHLWENSEHIKVTAFDFAEWVEQFENDYVIVKMDIEGAEFPVLEKLHQTEKDKMIEELWVEMHPNKVKDYTTTYSNELKNKLRCKVKDWH